MNVGQSAREPRTLVDILSMRVTKTPQRSAYIFSNHRQADTVVDHRALWDRAAGLAARVAEVTAPGDRVLLMCPPGPEFVYAFFACLLSGRIAVPVHLAASAHQLVALTAIVRDCGATAAIAPLATVPIGDGQLGPDIRVVDTGSASDGTGFEATHPDPEDIAFLQYTSGSTGSPKGVMVRHRNLMVNLGLIQSENALTPDNSIVSWLPPYHDMGLIQGALLPMFVGFPSVLLSPMTFLRDPLIWLRAIAARAHVVAGGPNLAYGLCAKRVSEADAAGLDLSGWDIAFVGAEPVDPNILRKFTDLFAASGFRGASFVPMYGLAESTLYVSGGRPGDGARSRAFSIIDLDRGVAEPKTPGRELISVGPMAPERIAVVDRDTGQRCAEHRIGEIWLRGDSIAAGYWNKPAETERAFHATLTDGDGTPYLRTGDLGFVADGELYISGRSKELMIVHGRNIFPQDVERTILAEHPALRPGGCAVFTARIDDEDRVMVVQELTDAQAGDATALAGSIRDIVSRVHGIGVHRVVFVGKGEVPKTTSGKIQRQLLRETYSTTAAR